MKQLLLINVSEGNARTIEAKAAGRDAAYITITADTLAGAADLIGRAEDLAVEACQNWQPAPAETKPQKHYTVSTIAEEDIQAIIADFENSDHGQKFIAELERAKAFRRKHEAISIRAIDAAYLAAKAQKDIWAGISEAMDIAFSRGYNRHKNETKRKVGKK